MNRSRISARVRGIKPSPSSAAADRASVLKREGKSIVRLHLATAAPIDKRQHALTYRRVMEGLYRRDLGWLTWK